MRISIIAIILVVVGCRSIQTVVKYHITGLDKIRMKIPKNYVFEGIQGDQELEHRYWYPDSSVLYITTFENTMNYDEIRKQETYYDRFNAIHSNDTLTLVGTTQNNLHWQDKLLKNGVTIGYSKVPEQRLAEFISALRSVKIKE